MVWKWTSPTQNLFKILESTKILKKKTLGYGWLVTMHGLHIDSYPSLANSDWPMCGIFTFYMLKNKQRFNIEFDYPTYIYIYSLK
jgi:hypothetical protein